MIAARVMKEIRARLQFLVDVGLDYLSLDRARPPRSPAVRPRGSASPRQIGSGLVGVLYVLDEPSVGPAPARQPQARRDAADDCATSATRSSSSSTTRRRSGSPTTSSTSARGPASTAARSSAQARWRTSSNCEASITGQYLSGKRCDRSAGHAARAPRGEWLVVRGAREHNLKGIDVEIPLGCFVVGDGRVGFRQVDPDQRHLARALDAAHLQVRASSLAGTARSRALDALDKVIDIDQSPIGRTPRSNPATYTGMFDSVRKLFAQTSEARLRGYQPGRFSFNVSGGRCEACAGDGTLKIEMHFLPDVYVPCEVCKGARYNRDTLEVTWRGRNIAEVLDLSCEEALEFFAAQPVDRPSPADARRRRPRLHPPRPTGADALRWGGPAGKARLRAVQAIDRAARSTSSTSRRPGSTSRTSASSWRAAAAGRPGQHRARDRAQPRRREVGRLGDRPRSRRRRRRWTVIAEGTPEKVAKTPRATRGGSWRPCCGIWRPGATSLVRSEQKFAGSAGEPRSSRSSFENRPARRAQFSARRRRAMPCGQSVRP